ncbi:MAG: DUF488 domain-containing protein [Flavobacteriales bacterium]|nr:DUF488 domain-containing protein [Flavobacteriales bacterium]
MGTLPLYSIGHGTRPLEVFLGLLKEHGIEYLIDVRTRPYSRFNPQYNRKALEQSLGAVGIRYVFMGDTLGGRPEDSTCYTSDGRADYAVMRTKDFFLAGMERLMKAHGTGCAVVMMCSESKPSECHRTRLIGQALAQADVPVMHIDDMGALKPQEAIMEQLRNGLTRLNLFGETSLTTSMKPIR